MEGAIERKTWLQKIKNALEFSSHEISLLSFWVRSIVEEKGLEKITVESLVADITPYARKTVPQEVKQLLLEKLKEFIIAETSWLLFVKKVERYSREFGFFLK